MNNIESTGKNVQSSSCWTNQVKIQPLSTTGSHCPKKIIFNVVSFNVLAESYLTPRSHKNIPPSHAPIVFDPSKRRKLLCDTLKKLAEEFDIISLQELDKALLEGVVSCLAELGYGYVYVPRGQTFQSSSDYKSANKSEMDENDTGDMNGNNSKGKKNGSARSDGCAIFYLLRKWACVAHEVVQFDDLADMDRNSKNPSSPKISNITLPKETTEQQEKETRLPKESSSNEALDSGSRKDQDKEMRSNRRRQKERSTTHPLSGMIASYKRSNTALLVRLDSKVTVPSISHQVVIGNAHLYWNPGYEYVKLSQSHLLMQRLNAFAKDAAGKRIPAIICGDMNSQPKSIVHEYFTKGFVDARKVAPWHYYYEEMEEEWDLLKEYGKLNLKDNSGAMAKTLNQNNLAGSRVRNHVPNTQTQSGVGNDNEKVTRNEHSGSLDHNHAEEHIHTHDHSLAEEHHNHSHECNPDDPNHSHDHNHSAEQHNKHHSHESHLDDHGHSHYHIHDDPNSHDHNHNDNEKHHNQTSYRKPFQEGNNATDENNNRNHMEDNHYHDHSHIHDHNHTTCTLDHNHSHDHSHIPKVRYLLDRTLSRFTRWLRILGLDAELENGAEERARTGEGKM